MSDKHKHFKMESSVSSTQTDIAKQSTPAINLHNLRGKPKSGLLGKSNSEADTHSGISKPQAVRSRTVNIHHNRPLANSGISSAGKRNIVVATTSGVSKKQSGNEKSNSGIKKVPISSSAQHKRIAPLGKSTSRDQPSTSGQSKQQASCERAKHPVKIIPIRHLPQHKDKEIATSGTLNTTITATSGTQDDNAPTRNSEVTIKPVAMKRHISDSTSNIQTKRYLTKDVMQNIDIKGSQGTNSTSSTVTSGKSIGKNIATSNNVANTSQMRNQSAQPLPKGVESPGSRNSGIASTSGLLKQQAGKCLPRKGDNGVAKRPTPTSLGATSAFTKEKPIGKTVATPSNVVNSIQMRNQSEQPPPKGVESSVAGTCKMPLYVRSYSNPRNSESASTSGLLKQQAGNCIPKKGNNVVAKHLASTSTSAASTFTKEKPIGKTVATSSNVANTIQKRKQNAQPLPRGVESPGTRNSGIASTSGQVPNQQADNCIPKRGNSVVDKSQTRISLSAASTVKIGKAIGTNVAKSSNVANSIQTRNQRAQPLPKGVDSSGTRSSAIASASGPLKQQGQQVGNFKPKMGDNEVNQRLKQTLLSAAPAFTKEKPIGKTVATSSNVANTIQTRNQRAQTLPKGVESTVTSSTTCAVTSEKSIGPKNVATSNNVAYTVHTRKQSSQPQPATLTSPGGKDSAVASTSGLSKLKQQAGNEKSISTQIIVPKPQPAQHIGSATRIAQQTGIASKGTSNNAVASTSGTQNCVSSNCNFVLVSSPAAMKRRVSDSTNCIRKKRNRTDQVAENSSDADLAIECDNCHIFIPPELSEYHSNWCIPTLTYNEDTLMIDKGECVICLEDLLQGDVIARLPCLCIYHKICIDRWFRQNRCCPVHPDL